MNSEKLRKIKEAGWAVGDIDLFLSPEEVAVVEVKFALAKARSLAGLWVTKKEIGMAIAR
jgi:hypothetical protein